MEIWPSYMKLKKGPTEHFIEKIPGCDIYVDFWKPASNS